MSKMGGLAQTAILALLLSAGLASAGSHRSPSSSSSDEDHHKAKVDVHTTRTVTVEQPSAGDPFHRRKTVVEETITETRTETFDKGSSSDTSSSRSSSTSSSSSSSKENHSPKKERHIHKHKKHHKSEDGRREHRTRHRAPLAASNGLLVKPCEGPDCYNYYSKKSLRNRDNTWKVNSRLSGIEERVRINKDLKKGLEARQEMANKIGRLDTRLKAEERDRAEKMAVHMMNIQEKNVHIGHTEDQIQVARRNCNEQLRRLLQNAIDVPIPSNEDMCTKPKIEELLALLAHKFAQREKEHHTLMVEMRRKQEAEFAALKLKFEQEWLAKFEAKETEFKRFTMVHQKMDHDARNLTHELDAIYARLAMLQRERAHEETRKKECDEEGCRMMTRTIQAIKPLENQMDEQNRLLRLMGKMDQLAKCLSELHMRKYDCKYDTDGKRLKGHRKCFSDALQRCMQLRQELDSTALRYQIKPIRHEGIHRAVDGVENALSSHLTRERVSEKYFESLNYYEKVMRENEAHGYRLKDVPPPMSQASHAMAGPSHVNHVVPPLSHGSRVPHDGMPLPGPPMHNGRGDAHIPPPPPFARHPNGLKAPSPMEHLQIPHYNHAAAQPVGRLEATNQDIPRPPPARKPETVVVPAKPVHAEIRKPAIPPVVASVLAPVAPKYSSNLQVPSSSLYAGHSSTGGKYGATSSSSGGSQNGAYNTHGYDRPSGSKDYGKSKSRKERKEPKGESASSSWYSPIKKWWNGSGTSGKRSERH